MQRITTYVTTPPTVKYHRPFAAGGFGKGLFPRPAAGEGQEDDGEEDAGVDSMVAVSCTGEGDGCEVGCRVGGGRRLRGDTTFGFCASLAAAVLWGC